ncbi:glucose-6-phosphate isomerase [Campylobacter insulaenigrae]|uniref:glucose-6-phosphate isomerase n=1 Tax=Campylobacter insulaenigrae TaxID=260714 RepID=UPI00215203A5|nr:glucose-6-phosphate isomerase [Campylobacter insulaenigrae]MCR6572691.1 glucose-6-phosphate isomerase [Campylobacter insulaenigrae]MCR6574075.1 glucose-6-phosphate isomerase [Campylobacter insulaenigrae]MCR6575417.1 glucose-6-phosphate isomerase [Campylobacter insulaenigrae]MCR6577104.1 glucose-6-phosphate isomerase [Campylobacter insulaenigrae]MCR6578939.1 glucose-6-phosphate isomerase [Campylobacter insulaenigrae]
MLNNTLHFKLQDLSKITAYANRMNDELQSGDIGYYHLVDTSLNLIQESKEFIAKKSHIKNIVLVGMGGSSCGVKALKELLFDSCADKNLFIIDNTSSHIFIHTMQKLNPEETLFVIASKSGTTIEVISLFKLIIAHFDFKCMNLHKYFVFITDLNSKLHKLADELNIKCFFIPKNVGGRFSVLSAIGIVPLSFCNYDTEALLKGAKACFIDFFEKKDTTILQKAYHYCTHKNAHINVLFSYGDAFKAFNEWYVQLIAESLGKKQGYKRIGLTPVALIGARDQHSFLQLIMDGPKDKTITFLKIKDSYKAPLIPNISFNYLQNCDFTNEINLHDLLNAQCDATAQALIAENLSVDIIELETLDAWHCGYLMYYYELFTSACGIMLGIDTYNQPGVEVGKLILKNMLSK